MSYIVKKCGHPLESITQVRDECDFIRLKSICPNCGAIYKIDIDKEYNSYPIFTEMKDKYDEYGYDIDGYDMFGYDINGIDEYGRDEEDNWK